MTAMKRRNLECALLILGLMLSLLSVSAFAEAVQEDSPLSMENVVVNDFDSTYYNDGSTVINNFGTVYNNGGTVFNNGGTVYNNGGVVYNNAGTVYNNSGAEVYNNDGTVHNNGGTVHEICTHSGEEPAPSEESAEAPDAAAEDETLAEEKDESQDKPQLFYIELAGDYSNFARIDGLLAQPDGRFALQPDGRAIIRVKEGLELTNALTSTGTCTTGSQGDVVLSDVDRDGTLTLTFKAAPPVFDLPAGSYGTDQYLSLSSPVEGAKILYTTDGTSPVENGKVYKKSIELERSVTVKAVLLAGESVKSDVVSVTYLFPELEEPDFEDVKEGYESFDFQPISLINTGAGTVKVESVSLHGLGKDCFELNTNRGGSVPSGQTDSRTWSIRPVDGLKAGEYEANLVFTLDSGDLLIEDVEIEVKK